MDDLSLNLFYRQIKDRFAQNGIENPALDARVLLCHALGLSHEAFVLRGPDALDAAQMLAAEKLLEQRLAGRPVAKIIGRKEFYGRDFKTTDDTLDPRPDSETLIDVVLRFVDEQGKRNTPLHILDLGTGTGCLLLTLLAELPHARGVAVDQSVHALAVAQENAQALGLVDRTDFVQSDWLQCVTGMFDIVISNPPYIPLADMAGLSIEVRQFDPVAALVGGEDGLDPYRVIIPQLRTVLQTGGLAAFELGRGQDAMVADMLQNAEFSNIRTDYDLAGIGRIVSGLC